MKLDLTRCDAEGCKEDRDTEDVGLGWATIMWHTLTEEKEMYFHHVDLCPAHAPRLPTLRKGA